MARAGVSPPVVVRASEFLFSASAQVPLDRWHLVWRISAIIPLPVSPVQSVRSGQLPPTSGFFFGQSDGTEQSEDLAFVKAAREYIADGYAVIYDSWW